MEGAFILRRKRVPVHLMDSIRSATNEADVFNKVAQIVPEWSGVLDVETGEPLPNPSDDPDVFKQLDLIEQLPWIREQLSTRPNGKASRLPKPVH